MTSASDIIERARALDVSIAVAESLTGGALTSALVDVPGASSVLRLGIVAYATPMKSSVLDVQAALLHERGAVDPLVARRMAEGVRMRASIDGVPADLGIATTGVAGPDPQDGHDPGEVYVGIAAATGSLAVRLQLEGDRAAVRARAVDAALEHVAAILMRSTGSTLQLTE